MERWSRSAGVMPAFLPLPQAGAKAGRLRYERHWVKCHNSIPALPGILEKTRQWRGTAIRPHRFHFDSRDTQLLLEYWRGAREQDR